MNPGSDYTKAYRSNLRGRFCDCGAPAVGYQHSGFVCQRCKDLEDAAMARELRRDMAGQRTNKQSGIEPYRILLPA